MANYISEDDIETDIQDEDLAEKNDTEQSSEPVKENVDITISRKG